MEEFDEGESTSLKSSSKFTKKESRRRNRSKLITLERKQKLIYYISISIIAFLILIILIYIFYKLISTERDSFNKQILTLNEEKNILEENNQIIKDENEEYKKKLYLNLTHQKKKNSCNFICK
jgi:flagellar biosynthesis/type III secretory pathway M-ring protein FliF/YscJ